MQIAAYSCTAFFRTDRVEIAQLYIKYQRNVEHKRLKYSTIICNKVIVLVHYTTEKHHTDMKIL